MSSSTSPAAEGEQPVELPTAGRATGRLPVSPGTGPLGQPWSWPGGRHPSVAGRGAAWKRGTDVAAALGLLVLLAPLMVLLAIAIRLASPGPAIFRQRRVGLDGRVFWMYKFRTMVADAETRRAELAAANEMGFPLFKVAADPRIAPGGKLLRSSSLDELPQLLNVLRGEMSLVGPRPPLVEEVDHFRPDQMRKFVVRPGLTGLWQVRGRNDLVSLDQMIALDLAYIRTWSPWLDLRILFATVGVLVRRTGR